MFTLLLCEFEDNFVKCLVLVGMPQVKHTSQPEPLPEWLVHVDPVEGVVKHLLDLVFVPGYTFQNVDVVYI